MPNVIRYTWGSDHVLELVRVDGTQGRPFSFGEGDERRVIDLATFFMAMVPVTRALWAHVMGDADAVRKPNADREPKENVSWDAITEPNGFLDRINSSAIRTSLLARPPGGGDAGLRLPSETEWEYVARGGPHWPDDFRFSGSDDIDTVAWYYRNSWDRIHLVAQKAPNQLGIYDMCGNVWEWCQDTFTRDVRLIPSDGRPYEGPGFERVLRGGCFHNGAIHCTVFKRYEIAREYYDGCIGFRLALGGQRG